MYNSLHEKMYSERQKLFVVHYNASGGCARILIGNLPLKRPKSGAANAKVKRTLSFAIIL
jgi:hypothetical protein